MLKIFSVKIFCVHFFVGRAMLRKCLHEIYIIICIVIIIYIIICIVIIIYIIITIHIIIYILCVLFS